MSWIRVRSNGQGKYTAWLQYHVYEDKEGQDPLRQGHLTTSASLELHLQGDIDEALLFDSESKAITAAQQYVDHHSWRTTWEQKP